MIERQSSSRGRLLVIVAGLLALGSALAAFQAGTPSGGDRLLITGARILDTRAGRYVAAPAVVVAGGRIEAILDSVPAASPAGARRLDLPGATLVPGLGDMFATASPQGSVDADFFYAMALAHGVTNFRVVGARLPWAVSQRDRARSGDLLAPRLSIGGARIDQGGLPSLAVHHVADAASGRREVMTQKSLGGEWVAVTAGTSPDVYRAVVRAARAEGLHVSGEPGATPVAELIRQSVDAIDRIGFFSRSRDEVAREVASAPDTIVDPEAVGDELWVHANAADVKVVMPKTVRRRPAVIPMLASFGGLLDAEILKQDPAVALLPASWREALLKRAHAPGWQGAKTAARAAEVRARLAMALATSGAPLVTGVDTESNGYNIPGAGVHREMALLVAAGLSPAEAIGAATINCAQMLGLEWVGQIKVGAPADLFAVEGDPLAHIEDLRRIKVIVRGGEVLDRADLLAQARRAAR